MADRLGEVLGQDQVGVVHSRAASFHLSRAACDDQDPSQVQSSKTQELQEREHASRAVAKANASRLFRELVRVTTPYQLLRGALGGTAHAATLIDTANSVFVFDELHAYEPARLGMILAMMNQWVQLGGCTGYSPRPFRTNSSPRSPPHRPRSGIVERKTRALGPVGTGLICGLNT